MRLIPITVVVAAALALTVLLVLIMREPTAAAPPFVGVSEMRGKQLIGEVGCGACHRIPGVASADGLVGPPLDHMSRRIYIAGLLRNTPANMVTWLRDPQQIVPGNAMPDLELTKQDARDITAYLYTLD